MLKEAYDHGRRALRGNKASVLDPSSVANLMLLWLSGLPEPLFPSEHIPELLVSLQGPKITRAGSIATIRFLLKKTEPFIVEALYPLFEFLHHYWINQPDRDGTLTDLAATFASPVFGTPEEHGLPGDAVEVFVSTIELLISEYRPLFTQPHNLQRYEQDLVRQAAATAAKSHQPHPMTNSPMSSSLLVLGASPPKDHADALEVGSPLLTPRRLSSLSVMDADNFFGAASPESSEWCAYIAQAREAGTATDPHDRELASIVDQLLETAVFSAFLPARGPSYAYALDRLSPMAVADSAGDVSDGSESLDDSSRDMSIIEPREDGAYSQTFADILMCSEDGGQLKKQLVRTSAC